MDEFHKGKNFMNQVANVRLSSVINSNYRKLSLYV